MLGSGPDLAPELPHPRSLRPLRRRIAALRATLPDPPTGTTPRGPPAGTAPPTVTAKHRDSGRLGWGNRAEDRPWRCPSLARAGTAERGGEVRAKRVEGWEAVGDARSRVSMALIGNAIAPATIETARQGAAPPRGGGRRERVRGRGAPGSTRSRWAPSARPVVKDRRETRRPFASTVTDAIKMNRNSHCVLKAGIIE